MEDIRPINEKSEGDCGYVAGYSGRKIAIYARSLSAAKDLAIAHLKVPKKGLGLVWVNLAERADGSVVLQSTAI